jgi:hypothetical protein
MNLKSYAIALSILLTAQGLASCARSVIAGPPQVAPPSQWFEDAQPYGTGEGLSAEQSQLIRNLAHRQSFSTMRATFGMPDAISDRAEYFTLNDRAVAIILYAGDYTTFIGIQEPAIPHDE